MNIEEQKERDATEAELTKLTDLLASSENQRKEYYDLCRAQAEFIATKGQTVECREFLKEYFKEVDLSKETL